MAYAIDGCIGVNLSENEGTSTALGIAPGREITADNGKHIRIIAGAALTTGDAVIVAASGTASLLTNALARAGTGKLAWAQNVVGSGNYGWAQMTGPISIRASASCLPISALYTSDTAGVLDDASASLSQIQIRNVTVNATNGAGNTATGGYVTGYASVAIPST